MSRLCYRDAKNEWAFLNYEVSSVTQTKMSKMTLINRVIYYFSTGKQVKDKG